MHCSLFYYFHYLRLQPSALSNHLSLHVCEFSSFFILVVFYNSHLSRSLPLSGGIDQSAAEGQHTEIQGEGFNFVDMVVDDDDISAGYDSATDGANISSSTSFPASGTADGTTANNIETASHIVDEMMAADTET